ncbi:MAG: hypothetical protein HY842_13090 [Bacteroidetes bacterium]|nr:hypothetical protein [Bacteroidota bacterium]
MYPQSKYRSKIYRDFRAIEPGEWRKIVRFYEENEAQIRGLDFDEYFELMLAYTNALFEISEWQKHLLMADAVIEASVMENLKYFNGEDVFQHTLFRKAASCYQLLELEKTDHILRELLRIDPHDGESAWFLKKCLRKMRPSLVRQTRAAAIGLFLLTALIICLEMLVVRPFYADWARPVELLRIGTFFLGIAVLVAGDVLHRWRSNREVERFVEVVRRRRK